MIPYLYLNPKRERVRTVSAVGTGIATALLGTAIPIIGVSVGIVLQLMGKNSNVVDGVVDGSAAVLARQITIDHPMLTTTAIIISPIPPVP